MSRITLAPNASGTGTLTVAAPNTNTDRTLTLPDVTTTLVGTDASQTLTNKSIAASQLTGALPAIDGSALTGVGSLTLLGTLATTSGTSVTLSGLTLTSYKMLYMCINGVSVSATTTSRLLFGGNFISPAIGTLTFGWYGVGIMELGTDASLFGVGAASTANTTPTMATSLHSLTTSSTSITVSSNGGSFDAGSITIYGVK